MTIPRHKRNYLSSLIELPRRLSRRRGFGIHSPFAFDFVRRVIAQPCQYYCYTELDRLARTVDKDRHQLRLLFRVALHVKPDRHLLLCNNSEAIVKTLDYAKSPAPSDTLLVVADQRLSHDQFHQVSHLILSNCVLVALNMDSYTEQIHQLWESLPHGMLFYGKHCAVLVSYEHLPHQKFNLWM